MNKHESATFQNLDFGTGRPTSVSMEKVEVVLSSENLLGDFSRSFVTESWRVDQLRAQQVGLTPEEMENYSHYLLDQRVKVVNGEPVEWRLLKNLYIPSFIQYTLSMIGQVIIRQKGLLLIPVMEAHSQMSYAEALAISNKIGQFYDTMQIIQDGMPRQIIGNVDVMSTALIAGYVRAIEPVEHVSSTYVTAFLGMKLKEELAMKVLYRVQYDDIGFIASAFTTQRGLV